MPTQPPSTLWRRAGPLLALAAALNVAIGVAMLLSTRKTAPERAAPGDVSTRGTAPAPRAFAVSLAPINVRTLQEGGRLTIPDGTDVVAVKLEGSDASVVRARVAVRTVDGAEIWRGPAIVSPEPGIAARADVPADRLRPNDYIVVLFSAPASGAEQERARYVLHVR